jgi:hypothetical protein
MPPWVGLEPNAPVGTEVSGEDKPPSRSVLCVLRVVARLAQSLPASQEADVALASDGEPSPKRPEDPNAAGRETGQLVVGDSNADVAQLRRAANGKALPVLKPREVPTQIKKNGSGAEILNQIGAAPDYQDHAKHHQA